jgi:hypothetical protein
LAQIKNYKIINELTTDTSFVVETPDGTRRVDFEQIAQYFDDVVNNGGIGEAKAIATSALSTAENAQTVANSAVDITQAFEQKNISRAYIENDRLYIVLNDDTTFVADMNSCRKQLDLSDNPLINEISNGVYEVSVEGSIKNSNGASIDLLKGSILEKNNNYFSIVASNGDWYINDFDANSWDDCYCSNLKEIQTLLTNQIPTDNSELTNGAGYQTSDDVKAAIDSSKGSWVQIAKVTIDYEQDEDGNDIEANVIDVEIDKQYQNCKEYKIQCNIAISNRTSSCALQMILGSANYRYNIATNLVKFYVKSFGTLDRRASQVIYTGAFLNEDGSSGYSGSTTANAYWAQSGALNYSIPFFRFKFSNGDMIKKGSNIIIYAYVEG